MNIFETHKKLVSCALPSGFEKPQGKMLFDLAKETVQDARIDTLGNVICHIPGEGPRIMFAAHMDVIGFMVNFIEKDGFLRVVPLGGHTLLPIVGQRVRFENGVKGVFGIDSDGRKAIKTSVNELTCDNVFVDIGALSREDAEKYVKVGDLCVFDTAPMMLSDDRMASPYCDDLTACEAMLIAIDKVKNISPKNDIYFVFTVQEEVGSRGAAVAAYEIAPDFGIACDVCFTGDDPQCENLGVQVDLGKGPTVKIKDIGAPASVPAVRRVRAIAEKVGIAYQDEILPAGGTDASAIQRTRGGALTTCISIPSRGIHSSYEIVSLRDIESAGELMAAICKEGM